MPRTATASPSASNAAATWSATALDRSAALIVWHVRSVPEVVQSRPRASARGPSSRAVTSPDRGRAGRPTLRPRTCSRAVPTDRAGWEWPALPELRPCCGAWGDRQSLLDERSADGRSTRSRGWWRRSRRPTGTPAEKRSGRPAVKRTGRRATLALSAARRAPRSEGRARGRQAGVDPFTGLAAFSFSAFARSMPAEMAALRASKKRTSAWYRFASCGMRSTRCSYSR